jgi:Na+-translocating ferredoxin:NAD+ oxidoreductase RNF subunit RnfB
MKKAIIAMFAVVAFAGSAFAAAQDSYEYKGGSFGKVAFNHKTHMKLGCTKCHEAMPPKKIAVNKDYAHTKGCTNCHKDMKKGPTGCKDCHKK